MLISNCKYLVVRFTFGFMEGSKNVLTPQFSQFTVYELTVVLKDVHVIM